MTQKNFALLSGTLFSLIALLHLFRVIYQWDATINGGVMPMWISWVALIVTAYLGWQGLRLSKKV